MNYAYRMHDARLGKFLSLDPLAPEYPWNSPYAFSENRVIDGVELEGLEWEIRVITPPKEKPTIEVMYDEKIALGYFVLVTERLGGTTIGEGVHGGTVTRTSPKLFPVGMIRYGMGGLSSYKVTLEYNTIFSTVNGLSTFVLGEIKKSEQTMNEMNLEPVSVIGTAYSEMDYGKGFAKNPQLFKIVANSEVKATFENFRVDESLSTINIRAVNIDSDYIVNLKASLAKQGFEVNLIKMGNDYKGSVSIDDDKNINGIGIEVDLNYDSDMKIKEVVSPKTVTSVEHVTNE